MQDRVGPAVAVVLAAPHPREAPAQVEAERAGVLLIDVHRRDPELRDRVIEQRTADAAAAHRVGDEEHLQ